MTIMVIEPISENAKIEFKTNRYTSKGVCVCKQGTIQVTFRTSNKSAVASIKQLYRLVELGLLESTSEDVAKEVLALLLNYVAQVVREFRDNPLDESDTTLEIALNKDLQWARYTVSWQGKEVKGTTKLKMMSMENALKKLIIAYRVAKAHEQLRCDTVLVNIVPHIAYILYKVNSLW